MVESEQFSVRLGECACCGAEVPMHELKRVRIKVRGQNTWMLVCVDSDCEEELRLINEE